MDPQSRVNFIGIYQDIQNDKTHGGDLDTHLRCKKKDSKRYDGTRTN